MPGFWGQEHWTENSARSSPARARLYQAVLLVTTNVEARDLSGSSRCSSLVRMCAQPKRFALSVADFSGVFRSGCHGVALAALTPQCCLPRGYGPWGARRWLGGLDRLCRARTSEDNKSGSHKHKSSPCLPVGERGMFLTGGGARWEGCCRSRGSCTPSRVLCSAELCIPCKMGTMSVRHGEPGTLCVRWARTSLCHADVTAAPGKGLLCPPGHPGAIPEPSQRLPAAGQQVSRFMASQNLCALDKLLFRSRNSRMSGWLLCSNRILHQNKKRYYAKIPIRSPFTEKKTWHQHAGMLM